MGEISNKDWTQYIKMDYAQNLRKHLKKEKHGLSALSDTYVWKKYY